MEATTTRYSLVEKRPGRAHKASCCVYLICAKDDLTKVGMSNNPHARLNNIRTANAERMSLEHHWRLATREQAAALEAELHRLFTWARVRREWFTVEPRCIRSVGNMLIAGDAMGADRLCDELRLCWAALAESERCRDRREMLNRRWDRDEREELANRMNEHFALYCGHYDNALRLGLEPAEWDLALKLVRTA